MKKIVFLVFAAMASMTFSLSAKILETSSLSESFETIRPQKGDLVVFDIDMTLLAPVEPAVYYSQFKKHQESFQRLAMGSPLLKGVINNLLIRNAQSQLIDPTSPQLIEEIQKKGVPVIALTACWTHPLGGLEMPQMRFEQLQAHGITMSNPTEDSSSIQLDDLELVLGYYPAYYRGVIISNPLNAEGLMNVNSKGEVLTCFLKKLSFKPKRVIFFDDDKKNLESVQQSLQKMGIEFEGRHYRGVSAIPVPEVSDERFVEIWSQVVAEAKALIESYSLTTLLHSSCRTQVVD